MPKIEVTCWDGKREACFEWKRAHGSKITVYVDSENILIEGMEGEALGVTIPTDLVKRAIAALNDSGDRADE